MTHRRYAGTVSVALLALLSAPRTPAAQVGASAEVVAVRRATVPSAPADSAWHDAPVFTAALLLQDMVEPRLLDPGTDKVSVRAITDGTQIAFRLDWADKSKDDLPGIAIYSDGCAVQLPVSTSPDVPAPQMGEAGRPVEITYWRAFWQGAVDGREDSIKALYPGATVDHYPFDAASLAAGSEEQQAMAKRYAPARALGNAMAGPRQRPVEDLIAEGPGTIRPADKPQSNGRGVWTEPGWTVVLLRPLPKGIAPGSRTQVAFAVWQGSHAESGARKMRSAWVPLLIEKSK
ncbi:MAG: Respiratory nitrate reductase subunit, conjectural [Deltaproteobacteria bacterium]|nr:Respiratory nitrate reductase subunit, conjectural [Deltaproteobacteria bacterium]